MGKRFLKHLFNRSILTGTLLTWASSCIYYEVSAATPAQSTSDIQAAKPVASSLAKKRRSISKPPLKNQPSLTS